METIIVWVLSIQLWTDPPPAIKLVYTKEFATREECMQAKEQWDWPQTPYQSLCLTKIKNVGTLGK
jgi:hypothetical protein